MSVFSSTADPPRAGRAGRLRRSVAVAAAVAVVLAGAGCGVTERGGERVRTATPTTAPPPTPAAEPGAGADGVGDPYFPTAGNGGYDVVRYDLDLTYEPPADRLTGVAEITATATADLTRFNLDLKDLAVRSVTVDGVAATATADRAELIVTPAEPIGAGDTFRVEVRYGGVPVPYGESRLSQLGFLHTDTGAIVIGEPHSAASWFPVNDHPRDKATYTIRVTAPADLAVLANGVLTDEKVTGATKAWTWSVTSPMAPYLATVVIGDYRVVRDTHDGRQVILAVDESLPPQIDAQLARTPEIVDFLAERFGPYPFDAIGGIVIDDERIRFALENQTRPIYSDSFFTRGDGTWVIVHEVAHQWFGDSVSVNDWSEIWLNEGFATYAEWLWAEAQRRESAQSRFDTLFAADDSPIWRVPPGDPGADNLFSSSVYDRGAMTLHALRMTVGDAAFNAIVKTWATEKADGNATTDEFITLAERLSGRQLDRLFDEWLYQRGRPPRP